MHWSGFLLEIAWSISKIGRQSCVNPALKLAIEKSTNTVTLGGKFTKNLEKARWNETKDSREISMIALRSLKRL